MNSNFKKYKNIHQGKRVFIIGNGPSLKDTNFDLIQDEYSIAMNRISLLYNKTEWRPSYYVYASSNCIHKTWGKEWTKSILESTNNSNIKSFIWEKYNKVIDPKNKNKNIEWIKNITEYKPNKNGDLDEKWWPDNIEERIDKSATTMNIALQLANYMGFSEIIFLGTDLGFTTDKGYNNDPNHFCKEYNADIPTTKVDKINNQMLNVHRLARLKIPDNVKMYNASLKSTIDIYPRICYEEYMKENKI
jgi:hypothetical protein